MRKPTSIIRMMQPRRDSFNDDVEEEEEERREAEILAALEAPEPPAEEVVARMHRELLVALAMPDAKLEELTRTEPVEKKWALIKMNAQLLRDKTLKKAALRWGDDKKDLLKRIDAELLPNLGTIGERKVTPIDTQPLKLIYPNSTLASLAQQYSGRYRRVIEKCLRVSQRMTAYRSSFAPCSVVWYPIHAARSTLSCVGST